MAYIEMHQSLYTHRKTLRLARLLGMDRFAAAGRLGALWSWALDNAQDGAIHKSDSDILADVMGWAGDPNELCTALVLAGFLEVSETAYHIHDWYEYAGKLIEKRRADAERKRLARGADVAREPVHASVDVRRMSDGRHADVAGNVPYPSIAKPTRIGDSTSSGGVGDSTEMVAADAALSPPAADDDDVVPIPEEKPQREPKSIAEDAPAMVLAVRLRDGILANKPDARVPKSLRHLQAWARVMDLMLRLDKRAPPDVEAMIGWCQADDFWRAVILSPGKLREKWDTMALQRERRASSNHGQNGRRAAANGRGYPVVNDEYYEQMARRATTPQEW